MTIIDNALAKIVAIGIYKRLKMQNKNPPPKIIGRSGEIKMFAGIAQSENSLNIKTEKIIEKSCALKLTQTIDKIAMRIFADGFLWFLSLCGIVRMSKRSAKIRIPAVAEKDKIKLVLNA